jgi:ribosomal protein S6--L-glutamate ligase
VTVPSQPTWILTDRRYLDQRMPMALVRWLQERGHSPAVVVADEDPRADWAGVGSGDLVVARSRHPRALALLEEAEARGVRILDGARSMHGVRDKHACARALARAGLPVPRTLLARHPDDVLALPDSAFPLVVKPVLGDNSRGVRVVRARGELDAVEWGDELHIAQAFVDAGGMDIKLYVAGSRVWATRRPSPLRGLQDRATRVPVTAALRSIAARCRRTFGLSLFGVDVLESRQGLAIVDVNEFPNYTGVDEAPESIGRLLLAG